MNNTDPIDEKGKEVEDISNDTIQNEQTEQSTTENSADSGTDSSKVQAELAEMKDKYLRLYSEFDNFRRRTSKEKLELTKTASEDVIVKILPVIDDLERAIKALKDNGTAPEALEGIELIYSKLFKTLETQGLKAMNATGSVFDVEIHEAITQIPSPTEDMKGKVIDEIEKGYYLHEKVIRFAKVVTGA